MNRLQRAAILTQLATMLRECDSWCGETHIQKAVFVLQELLGVKLGFSFILYKHGPYSFDLRDELTSLRADGLLELEPQAPPYRPRMAATARAQRIQKAYPRTLRNAERQLAFVAKQIGSKGVAELERLATGLYVTKSMGDSTARARIRRLLELKPHIEEHHAEDAIGQVDAMIKQAGTSISGTRSAGAE